MKAVMAILLVLVTGFFVATVASKGCRCPHFIKHRTKLREVRGFKPEYISTAIGFGKRQYPMEIPDIDGAEDILLSTPKNFPRSVPAEALLRAIQMNPALVNMLMQLSMQNDPGDEESTMDHSKSERTFM